MRNIFVVYLAVWMAMPLMAREIGTENADRICGLAGINKTPNAEKFVWHLQKSGDYPVYLVGLAVYKTNGFFYDSDTGKWFEQEVEASAQYRHVPATNADKVTEVNVQGGIANLKHSKKDFTLHLGYKIDGKDNWKEMKYEDGPVGNYTRYALEIPAGTFTAGAATEIWLEGRYQADGKEERVYESNQGTNFQVNVNKTGFRPICFSREGDDWREVTRDGVLKAGETAHIVYQHDRITSILNGTSYNGYPAWDFEGFYEVRNAEGKVIASGSFPGNGNASNPKNGSGSRERARYAASIFLPEKAKGGKLVLWFQGFARGGYQWDSDKSKNYVARIE